MTEMFLKDKNAFEKDVKDIKIMLQIFYALPVALHFLCAGAHDLEKH